MSVNEQKPVGSWLARHRGGMALGLSMLGFGLSEGAIQYGVLPESIASVALSFFEGALVGSLADWFAVTAIFHRIPIPFLSRHTQLLARKRAAMTESIVDMAENRWLSPDAVRTWLSNVSFADTLSTKLLSLEGQEHLQIATTKGFHWMARHVQHASVTDVMCRFWQQALHHCSLPTTLAPWCVRLLRNRTTEGHIYAQLAKAINMLHQQPAIMTMVSKTLARQLNASTVDSTWSKTRLWIGKRFLKGDNDAEKVRHLLDQSLQKLSQQLVDMSKNTTHPVRLSMRRQIFRALRHTDAQGGSAYAIEGAWQRLLPLLKRQDTAEAIAQRIQQELSLLLRYDTRLQSAIRTFIQNQACLLLTSPPQRDRFDEFLRQQCVSLLERYPHIVGSIVRESLSLEKLSTTQLVRQIEDKVGQEMQWIRVNGAVVGGLVAMMLTLLRMLGSALS